MSESLAPERSAGAELVLTVSDIGFDTLARECARFRLRCSLIPTAEDIPGSYWRDREAGLSADVLYVRADTPVHSALHEACHFVCMDAARREALERDAGGDYAEENAVCYLQIAWASELPVIGRQRMLDDMDRWGYTFRLGSAATWFESDADDAREWLVAHGVLDSEGRVTYRVRSALACDPV